MTINTKHLRDLIRRALPLPWMMATSNSYRRIVRADRYEEVCSPVKMPDGHPDLWFPDGFEGPNAKLLVEAANALPELLDRADRTEALDIIVLSVAAALARHGVKDADDPGEAIDVLVADKNREIARLREALSSIRQYGNDTLSGRADGGPDDRKWQREAVIEMRNRARAALAQEAHDAD